MGHNSSPGPTTEESLQSIYNNLKNQISGENSIRLNNKKQEAQQLQEFLTKLIDIKEQNNIFINAIRQALGKNANEIFTAGRGQAGGFQFENELQQVIENTFTAAVSEKYISKLTNNGIGNLGAKQTDIDIEGMVKQQIKDSYEIVGNYIKDNLIKPKEKLEKTESVYGTVDGKIDNSGLGYSYNIEAGITPEAENLLKILSKATFTTKNYAEARIKIGAKNANAYRSFMSAMSAANVQTPDTVFWRMVNCLNKHNNENVKKLAYGIRFIYELTGIGQHYIDPDISSLIENNNIKGAEFLIFRNNQTNDIMVKSTAQIIEDMLNDNVMAGKLNYLNTADDVLYSQIKIRI